MFINGKRVNDEVLPQLWSDSHKRNISNRIIRPKELPKGIWNTENKEIYDCGENITDWVKIRTGNISEKGTQTF